MGIISFANMFTIYLIIMGLMGVIMPLFNTPSIVILQEIVEEDMYGRVFSIVNIISSGIMPLSMILFGPLSDIIDIEFILIISSVVFIIMPFSLIKDKTIRNLPIINKKKTESIWLFLYYKVNQLEEIKDLISLQRFYVLSKKDNKVISQFENSKLQIALGDLTTLIDNTSTLDEESLIEITIANKDKILPIPYTF